MAPVVAAAEVDILTPAALLSARDLEEVAAWPDCFVLAVALAGDAEEEEDDDEEEEDDEPVADAVDDRLALFMLPLCC